MHQNAPHYSHVPQVLSCCMVLAGSKRECLSIPNSSFSYITTPIMSLKYPTAWFSGGLKCGKRGTNVQSNAIHNFPWYLSRLGFLCVILLVLLAQINPEKVHLEHPSTIGANSINNWCKYLPTFLPHSFSCVNFHCQVPLHGTSRAAPRSIVEVQESWSQMLSRTPSPLPFFARKSWNMGMSENGVCPQWNSHLVGIMIIKHWVFRGTNHFQTKPYHRILLGAPAATPDLKECSKLGMWST